MFDENKIRELFEEIDPENKIPESKINDLIAIIKEQEKNPLKDGDKMGDYTISFLQEQLKTETDWRKKASISAKIISLGLDT